MTSSLCSLSLGDSTCRKIFAEFLEQGIAVGGRRGFDGEARQGHEKYFCGSKKGDREERVDCETEIEPNPRHLLTAYDVSRSDSLSRLQLQNPKRPSSSG